ncbi:MAG: SPOR domain-containing protein [Alistipes sp.]|jgi:hypothetical protein|nr:SPOR domain-containing protein [Alistipes sp.]
MKTIDKLIFDVLAQRHSVIIAGVGTLVVKRHGARMISEHELEPPYNEVMFSPDELDGVPNVVSFLTADGETGEQEGTAMFNSWLEGARREDGTVTIEGVGRIGQNGFTVAEPLYRILNPNNEEIVVMETKKKSTPPWVWVVVAIAALLIAGAIFCWKKGCFNCGASKKTAIETVVTAPVADSLAAVETATEAGETASKEAGAVGTKAVATGSGRYHVIAGAFAVESNADNFVALVKRQHPELNPVKLRHPTNGLNMVSIFSADTRREASRKMNLYWDVDLSLWIYQDK